MIFRGVKYQMFGGKDREKYNALYASFVENAGGTDRIYEWLEKTPKTTMVVNLVDKLKEMGFVIVK